MSSIGETLRVERLRRGLTLEQISGQTKISTRHLEAIEAGDLDKLPGVFFTRSFVRQYAKALGFDEQELEPELDKATESSEFAPPASAPFRAPIEFKPISSETGWERFGQRRSFGSLIGFVIVVLACSGLYTLWQRARQPAPESVSEAQPAVSHAPAATPAGTPAQPNVSQAPVAGASSAPVQPPEPPAAQAPGASIPTAATAAQPAVAASDAPIQLQLGATEDTWIRVTSDAKVVFSGTLKPGQTRTFHAVKSMNVLTGNAGGLEVGWNGKPVGAIGPKGQVRVIEFTPEGHKIVERKPAARPANFLDF